MTNRQAAVLHARETLSSARASRAWAFPTPRIEAIVGSAKIAGAKTVPKKAGDEAERQPKRGRGRRRGGSSRSRDGPRQAVPVIPRLMAE